MKTRWLAVIVVVLAGLAGLWLLNNKSTSNNPHPIPTPTASQAKLGSETAALATIAKELSDAQTPEQKRAALERLRKALASGSTNEISAAIRNLLDSKVDGSTGQGFKVGAGGILLEAPTLRTLLLNQLATIDPAAASVYAKEILNSPSSPEEWAVALQSLARGDSSPDSTALLKDKTGELLRNTAWQKNPSVAYLEAFDTAVFVGGTTLLPPLTDLVRLKDNQAVAQAAFLALDRLVINQPADALAAIAEHPEWMTGREQTRANYFARADVGDPAQRQLVETYLLDPTRNPAELQAFAGVFPNANFMISNNLLSSNQTLDNATLTQRDRASLAAVNSWLADPRFANLHPLLQTMKTRLERFVK